LFIEIALGIVLAVLILANLEFFFSAAVWLAVIALGLGAAGAAIYWVFEHPQDAFSLFLFSFCIVVVAYLLWLSQEVDLRRWFQVALYSFGRFAGRVLSFRWSIYLMNNLFKSAKNRELDRRKKLGYDD